MRCPAWCIAFLYASVDRRVAPEGTVAPWAEAPEADPLAREVRGGGEAINNLAVEHEACRVDEVLRVEPSAELQAGPLLEPRESSSRAVGGDVTLSGSVLSHRAKANPEMDIFRVAGGAGVCVGQVVARSLVDDEKGL